MCQGYLESVSNRIVEMYSQLDIKSGDFEILKRCRKMQEFDKRLSDGLYPAITNEENFASIKTLLSMKVNSSDCFTDKEKEYILDDKNITPVRRPKVSVDYKPEKKYISRTNRDEWASVGIIGQLVVEDDGTCQVGGFARVSKEGILTKSTYVGDLRWPVIRRISDNVVRIMFR